MHEMAVTQSVLNIALTEGKKAGARRIREIRIRMGAYSDVVPSVLREYFRIAAAGTIAEGAEIVLTRVPVTMRCRSCGWQGEVDKFHIACGDCGGTDLQLLTGREFLVESLEAE
ncbi:MAG: hydrogenase maturation nickel metallochaperone HypA [Eubacteriales bacterium]|nr:hydrogenase maturation nickel metallochaperone HypA [Eubacteriales bacterium]